MKRLLQREGHLPALVIGVLTFSWASAWFRIVHAAGLFRWLGGDYAEYWAQARLLLNQGPASLYNLDALRLQLQALLVYNSLPQLPLEGGPVPYPPLFAWLFTPFALAPEPLGFAVWTAINFVAGVHLARRAASFFPAHRRWWVTGFVLTSLPVVYALQFGQPILLLACAFAEAYFCLRDGRGFVAGLWISCLLFKPQYGLLLAIALIWKRQWRVVLGAAAGGLVLLAASAVLVGPAALAQYPSALHDISTFNGSGEYIYAPDMINWRGIILRLAPAIADRSGVMLTLALGALTAVAALSAWRGRWDPSGPRFPAQMTALVLATLLANYHSHAHGAVLLVVPLAALLNEPWASRLLMQLTRILVFAPVVLYVATLNAGLAAWPFACSMLALLAVILRELAQLASAPGVEAREHVPVTLAAVPART